MPIYDFECPKGHEYEQHLVLADYNKSTKCPHCKRSGKKVIKPRQARPTFSEKIFPYYDKALNKVFENRSERSSYLKKKGYAEAGGEHMTAKQERKLLSWRQFDSHMTRNALRD